MLTPPLPVLKSFRKFRGKFVFTGLQLNASSISEFFTPDGVGVRIYSEFLHV